MFLFVCAKKSWVFGWKQKTEIKTENILPYGFSKLYISLLLVEAYCCNGWVTSEPGSSDLGYLIKRSADESALWLSTSPPRGGHQGASWQGKVWLKLCLGGGWTAMTIWPLRGWGSSSEAGYFLFLMLLLKSYLLWLSFLFSAWFYFWCYHFGDLAGCPCRIRGLYSHLFISAGFSRWIAELCEETWDCGNAVSSCSSPASLLPLQLLNSRTESTTVKPRGFWAPEGHDSAGTCQDRARFCHYSIVW